MKRFQKILVVLPENHPETEVLAWAATIAQAASAYQATVIRCLSPILPEYPAPEEQLPPANEEAEKLKDRLAPDFPSVKLEVKVETTEPLPAILHELSDGSYDLVLLSLVNGEGRILVERLSRKSPVGVIAIPDGCHAPPHDIVVGIDYSDLTELAMSWAEAFASLSEEGAVTLKAVNSYSVPDSTRAMAGVDPQHLKNHIDKIARQQINALIDESGSREFKWEKCVELAPLAGRHLAEMANRDEADLVVIGSHGQSVLKIALLGSHATDVIRLSKRPVLIVKQKNQSLAFLRQLLGLPH